MVDNEGEEGKRGGSGHLGRLLLEGNFSLD